MVIQPPVFNPLEINYSAKTQDGFPVQEQLDLVYQEHYQTEQLNLVQHNQFAHLSTHQLLQLIKDLHVN